MNNFLRFVFLSLLVLILCGCQFDNSDFNMIGEVWLNKGKITGPSATLSTSKGDFIFGVEIADTSEERTKGLMYRENMEENHGMFFIFDSESELNFWMKNTYIPLDIIFFDVDKKVLSIHKNVQPCKNDPCELYSSLRPAKYVLEVNAGVSDLLNVQEGDKITIKI